MPGIGGLSIANNLLANSASLNLNRNQASLQTAVTRLSSGLRINTAADDPSGLAIAESLQAQVNGFDQGARNVQDATNAAQVAEGALQTTTDILQRVRTLAVEGASDITSAADRKNLQSEVQQLLLEVNRISQNTNFNGQALLDGSHAGFQQQVDVNATITSNSDLAAGGTLVDATQVSFNASDVSVADGTIEVQVAQLTSTTQGLIVSFYDSKANSVSTTVLALNASGVAAAVSIDNVTIGFGAVGTLDVGVTSFIKISQYVAAASNPTAPAFNFQSGAAEGATIQVGFINTSTNSLRIANVNLLGPISNGNFSSGSLASEDSIGQIDNALQTVLAQRAQLGATIVRLQEDMNNDNVASVNLKASESMIRDLNVGSATTEYTKLQILVQVGTSVLAQANQNAQSVISLFR
ncbi:MAG: flagellin [Candidatus Eremiobacteraeota bacterium]|jgi:flagellin|nr:flagellin [Candidatus Eremiobacteraeota bacterium]MEA2720225.1 flagellin [Candidatus Eremiobacteraeota bacterium]